MEHQLSCPHGMWDFPRPGLNPCPLHCLSRLLTTGPPGSPHIWLKKKVIDFILEQFRFIEKVAGKLREFPGVHSPSCFVSLLFTSCNTSVTIEEQILHIIINSIILAFTVLYICFPSVPLFLNLGIHSSICLFTYLLNIQLSTNIYSPIY